MSKGGGSAFPCGINESEGMSLRDYFAAAALPGILAQWGHLSAVVYKGQKNEMAELDEELAAERAYRHADAMLAERAK